MKKLNLLILVSLLCVGLAQAQDADDPELQALIKTYKAMKAQQNAAPKEEANPQARYEKALINAAREGNASQVRGLLEQGINPNVKTDTGTTPLMFAAQSSLAAVDMLLYAGADVNAKSNDGTTPLIASLYNYKENAASIIKRILQENPDVNAIFVKQVNQNGKGAEVSPLALAAWSDQVDETLFAEILKRGASPKRYLCGNAEYLSVPLSAALLRNSPSSLKKAELLLQAGADPFQVTPDQGLSPLEIAKKTKDKAKIKLIKDAQSAGWKQWVKDNELSKAAEKGDVKKVKKLLAEGANPNAFVTTLNNHLRDGRVFVYTATPLAQAKNLEIVKLLLDAGGDINGKRWNNCFNRLHITGKHQADIEGYKWLIEQGIDINARNDYGDTPLIYNLFTAANIPAAERPLYIEKAWLLLKSGADPTIRNNWSASALLFASEAQDQGLIKELMKRGLRLNEREKKELSNFFNKQAQAQAQAQAAANNDGESLGKTFLKGLVDTGMSTLQYGVENGKF